MEGQANVLLIIALFVLRLGVPLLITVAIGYGLSRLDAKWQAEAETEQLAQQPVADRPQQRPVKQPAIVQVPTLQQTYVRDHAGRPCWGLKDCAEAVTDAISACERGDTPCWEARRLKEGGLPEKCSTCEVYKATVQLWAEAVRRRNAERNLDQRNMEQGTYHH